MLGMRQSRAWRPRSSPTTLPISSSWLHAQIFLLQSIEVYVVGFCSYRWNIQMGHAPADCVGAAALACLRNCWIQSIAPCTSFLEIQHVSNLIFSTLSHASFPCLFCSWSAWCCCQPALVKNTAAMKSDSGQEDLPNLGIISWSRPILGILGLVPTQGPCSQRRYCPAGLATASWGTLCWQPTRWIPAKQIYLKGHRNVKMLDIWLQ